MIAKNNKVILRVPFLPLVLDSIFTCWLNTYRPGALESNMMTEGKFIDKNDPLLKTTYRLHK
jgi:hypothetical protein